MSRIAYPKTKASELLSSLTSFLETHGVQPSEDAPLFALRPVSREKRWRSVLEAGVQIATEQDIARIVVRAVVQVPDEQGRYVVGAAHSGIHVGSLWRSQVGASKRGVQSGVAAMLVQERRLWNPSYDADKTFMAAEPPQKELLEVLAHPEVYGARLLDPQEIAFDPTPTARDIRRNANAILQLQKTAP